MMKTLRFWLVALCFLAASCARESDWVTRVDWQDIDSAHLPSQADYPEADAAILLDEGQTEIFGGSELGFTTFERHSIVRILNSRGQRFGNVVIPYGAGSRVVDIQARTIAPDGKITLLDKRNIFDSNLFPSFILFSDERAKIFTLPALDDGVVVEYRYQITIPNRMFWHSWRFQSDVPTLRSRFTLIKPSEWEVKYRTYGIHVEPSVVKTPEGFKSTHRWELRNVPPLRAEVMMPPYAECGARLALAPAGFKAWVDVSKWYSDLSAPRMKAGSDLQTLAARLVQGATSDKEKLRRLYEWVRDKIRYVAVEIDIGGFQPHFANDVYVNRYGDCKDMATILCALGKESGLDMRQVLISTRQNGEPDTSLASPLQFNHAIAYCPSIDGGIWLDATEKGCPFGELPWYDQDLPVLVVGAHGEAELLRTPRSLAVNNCRITNWQATLDTSGDARVNGVSVFTGAYAIETRDGFLNSSPYEARLQLETWLAKRCDGVRLDSFVVVNSLPPNDSLRIEYTFEAKRMGVRQPDGLAMRPGAIGTPELQMYFRTPHRTHPVRFNYGMRRELNLRVSPPLGWTMRDGKGSDSIGTAFGSAGWNWQQAGEDLSYHSYYQIDGDDIPPESYPAWQSFLDRLQEENQSEIVFMKK